MLVCSYNCRGLGGRIKKSRVGDITRTYSLYFLAVQKTKISNISYSFVHSLWGNQLCDLSFSISVGSSGGLLSIWCSMKGRVLFSFFSFGYMDIF